MTIQAVYERGLFRPVTPLQLPEGHTVEVIIPTSTKSTIAGTALDQKLQQAQSLDEWIALTKQLPADDGGYDVLQSLTQTRIANGERPLVAG